MRSVAAKMTGTNRERTDVSCTLRRTLVFLSGISNSLLLRPKQVYLDMGEV